MMLLILIHPSAAPELPVQRGLENRFVAIHALRAAVYILKTLGSIPGSILGSTCVRSLVFGCIFADLGFSLSASTLSVFFG